MKWLLGIILFTGLYEVQDIHASFRPSSRPRSEKRRHRSKKHINGASNQESKGMLSLCGDSVTDVCSLCLQEGKYAFDSVCQAAHAGLSTVKDSCVIMKGKMDEWHTAWMPKIRAGFEQAKQVAANAAASFIKTTGQAFDVTQQAVSSGMSTLGDSFVIVKDRLSEWQEDLTQKLQDAADRFKIIASSKLSVDKSKERVSGNGVVYAKKRYDLGILNRMQPRGNTVRTIAATRVRGVPKENSSLKNSEAVDVMDNVTVCNGQEMPSVRSFEMGIGEIKETVAQLPSIVTSQMQSVINPMQKEIADMRDTLSLHEGVCKSADIDAKSQKIFDTIGEIIARLPNFIMAQVKEMIDPIQKEIVAIKSTAPNVIVTENRSKNRVSGQSRSHRLRSFKLHRNQVKDAPALAEQQLSKSSEICEVQEQCSSTNDQMKQELHEMKELVKEMPTSIIAQVKEMVDPLEQELVVLKDEVKDSMQNAQEKEKAYNEYDQQQVQPYFTEMPGAYPTYAYGASHMQPMMQQAPYQPHYYAQMNPFARQPHASALMMQAQQMGNLSPYAVQPPQAYELLAPSRGNKQDKINGLMQKVSMLGAQGSSCLLKLLDSEFDIIEQLLAGANGQVIDSLVKKRDSIVQQSSPFVVSAYTLIIDLAAMSGKQTGDSCLYYYFIRRNSGSKELGSATGKKKFLMQMMYQLEQYYQMIEKMQHIIS